MSDHEVWKSSATSVRVRQNLRVIEYRTPTEIEQMRPAGRFVAEVLSALIARAEVGVNLLELDELAHKMIRDRGAESCYIDYHPSFGASPFGKVLCTSVNDAVLHGLPHDYELVDGDLVSLDFAASVDGWVSDSAISVIVGSPREQDQQLIATAEAALAPASRRRSPATRSVTSPSPSRGWDRRRVTRSTPSSAGMVWVVRCTATLTYRTTAGVAAGYCFGPAW